MIPYSVRSHGCHVPIRNRSSDGDGDRPLLADLNHLSLRLRRSPCVDHEFAIQHGKLSQTSGPNCDAGIGDICFCKYGAPNSPACAKLLPDRGVHPANLR